MIEEAENASHADMSPEENALGTAGAEMHYRFVFVVDYSFRVN